MEASTTLLKPAASNRSSVNLIPATSPSEALTVHTEAIRRLRLLETAEAAFAIVPYFCAPPLTPAPPSPFESSVFNTTAIFHASRLLLAEEGQEVGGAGGLKGMRGGGIGVRGWVRVYLRNKLISRHSSSCGVVGSFL